MAGPFKVVVFTPVWGRHEILKRWAEGVNRIKNYWPDIIEIIPLCIVSNQEDKEIVQSFGFGWCEAENLPLGRKHNAGLDFLRKLDFDYILQLGSDDVISNEYLHYILPLMIDEVDMFGVGSLYFAEPKTKKACRFDLSTHANTVIGAGRCISHRAIETLDYKLWPDEVNKGLDMTSQANLQAIDVIPYLIQTSDICVLDIKSDTNIWSYDTFGNNFPKVDYSEVSEKFKEL